MKKFTHIFFDLDHTLWDTDLNAEESLREIFEELELSKKGIPDFETFHTVYRQHNERLWGLYAENKVGKDVVRTHRFQHTLADFGIHNDNITETLAEEFVRRTPRKKNLLPGAIDLLEQLNGKYHLSIITNGFKEAQYVKLEHSGIRHFFDTVFVSEEVGVLKPDPEIFRIAMEKSGAISAADCMMVGDTYQTDIFGALNSGMTPVHYAPNHETEYAAPVITVRHLSEINTLLD